MTDTGREPHEGEEQLVAQDDAAIGRAFRRSWQVALVLVVVIAGAVWWSTRPEELPATRETDAGTAIARPASLVAPPLPFTDVTAAAGIDFVHENGARGDKLLPETMGAGVAVLDVDSDGDPDLLFANARPWSEDGEAAGGASPGLFLNAGDGSFSDESAAWGLDGVSLYGTGVALGDVDGDGDRDVHLSAVGPNLFLRHDGERFVDATAAAGLAGDPSDWSTSAGFFDADLDGDLDLFVCNYVGWSREIDLALDYRLTGVGRAYGPPTSFEGAHCRFLLNDGSGVFSDVSEEAGVLVVNEASGGPVGKALGLAPVDLDQDGLLDLVVANDTVRNFLFRNLGDGRFEEIGARAGLAYGTEGNATGAMGVDVADYRNEASLAIGMGNFANEMTSLYVADREPLLFSDVARIEGIGGPSRSALSFGLLFLDADLDGYLDLFQTNGHLEEEINTVQPGQHYRQPSQLFWNAGAGARSTFLEVPAEVVGDLARPIVGRGAAYADLDGDGDLDLVVTQSGAAPLVLRNDQDRGHHWLRVRLVGPAGATEALGARVVLAAGGQTQRRSVMPTRSYLSQVELPVTFGLGDATVVDRLEVTWPDGEVTVVPVDGVDRELVVRRED